MAQMVKILPAMKETQIQSLGQEDPLKREWHPLQQSCLKNTMDRGAWWAIVHGFAKSCTQLNNWAYIGSEHGGTTRHKQIVKKAQEEGEWIQKREEEQEQPSGRR